MTTPVDIPEIERLTKELAGRLYALTGCKPGVDVWFLSTSGDTHSLAHDAVACGYLIRRIPDRANHSPVSLISVQKWISGSGNIYIHIRPRKARQ